MDTGDAGYEGKITVKDTLVILGLTSAAVFAAWTHSVVFLLVMFAGLALYCALDPDE